MKYQTIILTAQTDNRMAANLKRIVGFYRDGFQSMTVGRSLWRIILIKLVVLYVLLKLFFPNYLRTNFLTDQDRAAHVLGNLTRPAAVQQTFPEQRQELSDGLRH